jgi:hypothetical protein
MTLANTQPFSEDGLLNLDSLSYVTLYGPQGAVLNDESDPPYVTEEPLGGHSGASWVLSAEPLGETSVTIGWDVPEAAVPLSDGSLEYRLRWLRVPGHSGDVVNLQVEPPDGWRWADEAPPTTVPLSEDIDKAWSLVDE